MSPAALACLLLVAPPAYDPLFVADEVEAVVPLDLDVRDAARDRTIPVRVRLPMGERPAPVILFSHGLGGSRAGGAYLAEHWAAHGFVCVNLQHPGSDEAVWTDVPRFRRVAAMKTAASGENLLLRLGDVPAVLDRLAAWNAKPDHPLFGLLDLERVGMSGHSFGARTAQGVAGEAAQVRGIGRRFTDRRVDAAVILSPSPPKRGDPAAAFGSVSVPWLSMTGTEDESPIGGTSAADRLDVFPHLPATVDRYQLVLDGAEHSAFGDGGSRRGRLPRNPNHHRAILALSTAFWEANLNRDPAARAWLDGPAAKTVLEPTDEWDARSAASRPAR